MNRGGRVVRPRTDARGDTWAMYRCASVGAVHGWNKFNINRVLPMGNRYTPRTGYHDMMIMCNRLQSNSALATPLKRALFVLCLCCCGAAKALPPLDPQADHSARWNWFAEALYDLHQRQLAAHQVKTEVREDGYYRNPRFYIETRYIDAASGRVLSVLQRERDKPENIHSLEVFVYDNHGRIARDYSVLYLPHSRSAPQHTLINLHAYHGDLHAFRQFDATDNRLYEFCQGKYQGKKVEIRLDEFDLIKLEGKTGTILETPQYRSCFHGLPRASAGKYLTPQ